VRCRHDEANTIAFVSFALQAQDVGLDLPSARFEAARGPMTAATSTGGRRIWIRISPTTGHAWRPAETRMAPVREPGVLGVP